MPAPTAEGALGCALAVHASAKQFLTTMDPDVIRAIKQAALNVDRTASDVMEEAAKQWLARLKHKK
jgi:hypothetical protein